MERIEIIPAIVSSDELPELPPPLIDKVIRRGGKLLLAGASKSGKSFALIQLAAAAATGGMWLDFQCVRSRVLYVNLEIQEPQFMRRLFDVIEASGANKEDVRRNLDCANLRGKYSNITRLVESLLETCKRGDYDLVIIDPAYKVQPGSENDADSIARFCSELDRLAEGLACSIAYSHHHSKGAQGGKNAADRASGSGVFARDADALIDVIELERQDGDPGTPYRFEFVLRDFAQPPARNAWRVHPVLIVDEEGELDGRRTRMPGSSSDSSFHDRQSKTERERLETALDRFMGDRDEVNRKDFEKHYGRDARTIVKYLEESDRFENESSHSSAVIRRKSASM